MLCNSQRCGKRLYAELMTFRTLHVFQNWWQQCQLQCYLFNRISINFIKLHQTSALIILVGIEISPWLGINWNLEGSSAILHLLHLFYAYLLRTYFCQNNVNYNHKTKMPINFSAYQLFLREQICFHHQSITKETSCWEYLQ